MIEWTPIIIAMTTGGVTAFGMGVTFLISTKVALTEFRKDITAIKETINDLKKQQDKFGERVNNIENDYTRTSDNDRRDQLLTLMIDGLRKDFASMKAEFHGENKDLKDSVRSLHAEIISIYKNPDVLIAKCGPNPRPNNYSGGKTYPVEPNKEYRNNDDS